MFLKKIAEGILKGGKFALTYGLGISALTPTKKDDAFVAKVSDTLTHIADLVVISETFGQALQLGGVQKLDGIQTLVRELILKSELMTGKEIADEEKFAAAVRGIASNVVDLLNSVKPA